MLILKVFSQKHQRTGTKKDGTEFKVIYQEAEVLRRNRRPRLVEVSSPKDGAYVEGLYTLDESSFRPDNYDRLSLSPYIRLMPLNDAVQIATEAEELHSARPKQKS